MDRWRDKSAPYAVNRIGGWRTISYMPNYRRARVPGAAYFFTVTLADRSERILVQRVDALRNAFVQTRRELPFRVEAMVVLPEHLHCIWSLPDGDADFSLRWQRIKARFTHLCRDGGVAPAATVRHAAIWQKRFWEHLLRDEQDFERHVDYIHFNPVKHGHTTRAIDWPYSSIHRYVRSGVISPDWAEGSEIDGCVGER